MLVPSHNDIFDVPKQTKMIQKTKFPESNNYIEILEEVLNAEVYESSYTPEYYENQEVWLSQQIDETVNDRS